METLFVNEPSFGQPITAATTFAWEAGSNDDAYIYISTSNFSVDGNSLAVDCVVLDDGEFSFPAATQSEMGDAFIGLGVSIWRDNSVVYQQGNGLLILNSSSQAHF